MVPQRARLYAMVDAARDADAIRQAEQLGLSCASLFDGSLGHHLVGVAPHLVTSGGGEAFRRWWFERWGNSVGVLVEAPVGPDELRAHLRTLMIVSGDERRKYYFRFYDPRVLRRFLPSCTPEEGARFFGPIRALYCEGPAGADLLKFTAGEKGVAIMTTTAAPI